MWKNRLGVKYEGFCFIKIACKGSYKMRLSDRKLESDLS